MLLLILSFCGFVSAMSGRMVDPAVTAIAADFAAPISLVGLLASAYTLPFAFIQPILGPVGDIFSKTRVIKIAVVLLAMFSALGAVAPNLDTLVVSRILAGIAGGGILPVAFALIGDSVRMADRQVAISRFLAATLLGQIVGASFAGVLADTVGWRGIFWTATTLASAIAASAIIKLPETRARPQHAQNLSAAIGNYGAVLRNPLSFVCFGAVAVEGAVIFGWLPYIGSFLEKNGMGGSKEAGFVISGLAVGGLLYSLSVPTLLRFVSRRGMMAMGGLFAAAGLVFISVATTWPAECAFMAVTGFGFFMLHNPLQTEVSELAPDARSSAFSLHAFSYYSGQAVGPLVYSVGMNHFGLSICLIFGAVGFLSAGLAAPLLLTLLSRRTRHV
jgi:predicted MFS family arabinose efflux permease